jgi:tetratricopeptide (TPR) repeat protein
MSAAQDPSEHVDPAPEARWQRLWAAFHAALETAPPAREAVLRAHLGEDAEALGEARALLAAHAARRSPLDHNALSLIADAPPPATLGDWRLLRPLGEGGMGSVWLAERSDGDYVQLAAIKLIDAGLDRDRLFLAERRSLAKLRHPHIAQFYDSGVSEDGRRYLVMEYVEGERLDAWMVRARPALEERLGLLVAVCRAVHFAHRNLVVHLDLKPGNVLVTAEGVPKIIDFGIASAPGQGDADGWTALTLAYASPEQLLGEPASTASDVFALGLLLYELCTGERPFRDAGDGEQRLAAIRCGVPPLARARRTQRPRLLRRLGRWRLAELDALIAGATAARAEQRYASAADLAEDIGRWLARRPLRLRGGGNGYRLRAWLARRPYVAGASLAAVLIIGGFVAALALQARELARALEQARAQALRAEAAAGFLADLFTQADPEVNLGAPPTAADVLEGGAVRLDGIEDAGIRAKVAGMLGRAFLGLGEFERAERMLGTALTAESPGARAEALQGLAWVAEERAQFDAAEAHQRAALALLEGAPDEAYWRARLRLAAILQRKGRLADAAATIEGIETQVETNALLADIRLRQGGLAFALGDMSLAELRYREALSSLREAHGNHHPQVARALYALGVARHSLGRHADARAAYEEALALRLAIYGEPHHRSAEVLTALAALHQDAGDSAEAAALAARALAMLVALHGGDSPRLAQAHNNLGVALHDLGRFDAAETHFREALARHAAALEPDHPHVLGTRANLALLALDRGETEAAVTLLAELRQRADAALPDAHPTRLGILHLEGRALLEQGRFEAGRRTLAEATARRESAFGTEHPALADSLYWLAWAEATTNGAGTALPVALRAAAIREARLDGADWRVLASRLQVAALEHAQSGNEAHAGALERAARAFRARRGEEDWMWPAVARRIEAAYAGARASESRAPAPP